jgi:hypothetical protein
MIGVTAILIATKFEEIYPLRIKTVESIKQKECEFLEVLNFKVVGFSLYDSLMLCLHTINQGNLIIDSEM